MAALDGVVTFHSAEYRPCYVDGKKALFHRWTERSEIIPPSPMIGGHGGGCIKFTSAIIEYDDGSIAEVEPSKIRFADRKINEYKFDFDFDKHIIEKEIAEALNLPTRE